MNSIKRKDITTGIIKEKMGLPVFEQYFNTKLIMTSEYNTFDYINDDNNIYIELKNRNNNYSKYPTTMVSYSKIKKGYELLKKNNKIYYCFNFKDGLYYYQQTEQTPNEIEIGRGGRKDRGRYEYNTYAYIPIKLLKCIKNESL